MWPGRTWIGASTGLMGLFVLQACGGSSAARDEQAWRLAEKYGLGIALAEED